MDPLGEAGPVGLVIVATGLLHRADVSPEVDWFNHRRLLEPIGNMPPAEAEARYHTQAEVQALAA